MINLLQEELCNLLLQGGEGDNPVTQWFQGHKNEKEKRLISCRYQLCLNSCRYQLLKKAPGRVAQSVGHLTRKSGVLGSIPGLATYFYFSFRFFKKGSCQLLAKVCARSTG